MIESIFYKSSSLKIGKTKIDDILILVNNNFASNEKKVINIVKLMIKNCK